MTKITASPPVLAELSTDTTEAVKHTALIHRKRKRTAYAAQSNALPVMSTEAMFMSPVLSTECIPACHVMSRDALPNLVASPVMAMQRHSSCLFQPWRPVPSRLLSQLHTRMHSSQSCQV